MVIVNSDTNDLDFDSIQLNLKHNLRLNESAGLMQCRSLDFRVHVPDMSLE